MSETSKGNLSIIPYLYIGTNSRSILEHYCDDLRELGGRHNLLHSNMLSHYIMISEDREFILSLQKSMTDFFFSYLHCYHQVEVFGRKKGLISLEDKCNRLLTKRTSPEVHDNLGFRIILYGKSPEELVRDCYSVMDKCIDFFIAEGFTPTKGEKKSSTSKFDPTYHPRVYVPKKSLLRSDNKILVKDYILNPKDDGYQSLHVIMLDSQGREFEVQIRSHFMDQYADSGPASHRNYKASRYKDDEVPETDSKPKKETFVKVDTNKIDINRIASEYFIVTGNPDVPFYDKVGIFNARVFLELSNI